MLELPSRFTRRKVALAILGLAPAKKTPGAPRAISKVEEREPTESVAGPGTAPEGTKKLICLLEVAAYATLCSAPAASVTVASTWAGTWMPNAVASDPGATTCRSKDAAWVTP